MVVSLGVVDRRAGRSYLFEATPDLPAQLRRLRVDEPDAAPALADDIPDGVFLTHAHIGHYTGLMYFGKEAMGPRHRRGDPQGRYRFFGRHVPFGP